MSKVRLAVAALIVASAGLFGSATAAAAGTPLDIVPHVSITDGLHLCC